MIPATTRWTFEADGWAWVTGEVLNRRTVARPLAFKAFAAAID
jgi:hypothetical protein